MNFLLQLLENISNNILSLIQNLPLILLALLGLCILVVFHEFGHFIFCKIFNVYTPSFSIGFGPRLLEKKIGDTVFAISAIPLGGYVEIAGSKEVGQGEQAYAELDNERSFNNKPYWQKMLIIFGGVLFNIIFTYITMAILFYIGSPCISTLCQKYNPIIEKVEKNSPADKAGLISNDKIIKIENQNIENIENLSKLLENYINKNINITIIRDKQEKVLNLTVDSQKVGDKIRPKIGVYWHIAPMSLKNSIIEGAKATYEMVIQMFKAIATIFTNRDQIGGPLMVISELAKSIGLGFKIFLFMLAFISINLAVLNIIPLPIFDGGQALIYTIEAIIGRPISEKIRYNIQYFTWLAVIILIIYVTYKDIVKILNKIIKH